MADKRPFYYFLLVIGLNGVLGNLLGYFLPIYFKDLGFSGLQVGLYFSISSIATILMSLPMGVSTDRVNIVGILVVSFFLMGLSKFGFVISRSFLVFCVFSFLGSFGGRFYYTAITSMFFKHTGPDNQKEAGQYQLVHFVTMGMGMILGACVIARFDFHAVFVFGFITHWILMGLSLLLPRNDTVTIRVEEYKKAVINPNVIFICVIFSLSSLHGGAEFVAYGPFLKEVLGLGATQVGLYTGVGFWFVGIGAYLGYVLLRKGWVKDLQTVLMIGFFLSGVFHMLMCVHNVGWSFAFRLVHEIGDGFVFLGYYHGIAKVFHIDKIGGCQSFISLWMSISSLLSSTIFGVVGEKLGYQWPLIISGMVLAVLPLLLFFRGSALMQGGAHSGAPAAGAT